MLFVYIRRRLITGILALLFFLIPAPSGAAEILPLEQITPGMHGVARTVVSGTAIEEFGVEVLGIMKDKGPAGDLILVRVYGDIVEKTGIAQGMSGSPVYIDGKLVGAIAYGYSMTDSKVGMVTPIADMLKLWELRLPAPAKTAEAPLTPETEAAEPKKPAEPAEPVQPLVTPVMAAGFTDHALVLLKEKLKPFYLVPYGVGLASGDISSQPFQPGSAVGAVLVRGDVSLGALGTVTYVEDGKILAFGHPFLKKGHSNYFLTHAHIFTTLKGLENSFKVGVAGEAAGMLNQDRSAGVAGVIEKYPTIIPLRIMVKDNNTGASRDAAVQVIQDEQLSPIVAATTVFNVIDKTIDRAGSGTARISFTIAGRHMPVDEIKRDNMFYTSGNIAELVVSELHEALTVLADNQYQQVDIMDVKVDVTVDSDRKTAAIREARAAKAQVKPGETVDITVKMKPFRGEMVTQTVPFTVPKNQQPGPLTLVVRGGGYVPLLYSVMNQAGMEGEPIKPRKKQQSFEKIVKDFMSRDRNNDIVVEVMDMKWDPFAGEAPTKQSAKNKESVKSVEPLLPQFAKQERKSGSAKEDLNKSKFHHTTDYVVEGDTQVMVEVLGNSVK